MGSLITFMAIIKMLKRQTKLLRMYNIRFTSILGFFLCGEVIITIGTLV